MLRLFGLSRRATAALVLGLGLATATSAQPTRDLDARFDRAAERLDLTAAQRAGLDAIAARSADADLWTVTAEVHTLLTAEQRAALSEPSAEPSADRARGERGRRGRSGGAGGERGRRGGDRGADRGEVSDADRAARDAAREAARPLREAAREEKSGLRERLRSGDLSAPAYAEAVRALRERTHAQLRAAATPEQRERMDARHAERQAATAARDRVLGLTDAQKAQLDALHAERIRAAPGRDLDVRPYLDADGRLDRSALRQARRAERPQREAAREAARTERAQVLTERQRELIAVHRALAGRQGRGHRRGGRRGGRG